MFFVDTNESTSAFEPSSSRAGSFAAQAAKEAKDAVNPAVLIEGLKEIENIATQTSRTIFGQFGSASDQIQKTIIETYKTTVKLGASLKDNIDIYQSIGKSLQRNVYLTDEQLGSLVAIQRATNLSAEEIGSMVTGFQDLGQGTDKAIESTEKLSQTARKYGLNVNTFLKTVGDNIKLVNSYGFKDGVEGLGRMVARAQALRMNFAEVKGLAADLLSPESAIELAATMQTLGGEIGALGDFGQLMYMAENDMEGLQNSIIDAAKSAVMFNEETGEFKITGVEMRRLREQARALGLNYEDLANTAVKAAKEQRVMETLDFTGLNQDQKQLIANLSEIGTNGQIKINVPGFEDVTDVTKLTAKQFKDLEDFQKKSELSSEEVALQSLSIQDKQLVELRRIKSAGLVSSEYLSTEEGSKGEDLEALLRSVVTATGRETTKAIETYITSNATGPGFDDAVTSFITGSSKFVDDFGDAMLDFKDAIEGLAVTLPSSYKRELNITDPVNQFKSSLDGLTVTVNNVIDGLQDIIDGTNVDVEGWNETNDFISYPGGQRMLTVGADTFKINDLDTIIGGTFPESNRMNNNDNTKNISFNPLEIKINVAGVTNQDFVNMMKSNEFTAAVRKQILSGIGSPLGNTTAGYV